MGKKRKADDAPADDGTTSQAPLPGETLDPGVNRRKKTSQARTLRACDRCQLRKLACDGALNSCQQCQKAGTWCTMTDPVTGNPYYRGQFEYLEQRVQKQNQAIKELLTKLQAIGQDVSGYEMKGDDTDRYDAWKRAGPLGDHKPVEREERHLNDASDGQVGPSHHTTSNLKAYENAADQEAANRAANIERLRRPSSVTLTNMPARNFVGVSTNSVLSKTKPGTRLNILGWELDIADFEENKDDEFEQLPDFHNPVYDRSYRSFIATTHGLQPRLHNVKLPSRQQAFNYALQQLHTMGAFVPVLHKTSFTELLTKFYDDQDFRPSVGEEVCIHMSFAISYYQTATRNFQNKEYAGFHELSNQHYHYALGFWPQLMIGNTLEEMQALAMISAHARGFPKPECGWIAACTTFNRLIQLDYHRSANSEQSWVADKSFLELEMRKRLFWSVLVLVATANGKLGRPMPMRWEDFDVEFPLAVNDEQITATGRDETKTGQCHFLPAIESFRIEPIFADLYITLYALRKLPRDPVEFVELAEKRLQAWWDSKHPDLREDSPNPLMRVLAHYLSAWRVEYRLLLYHPSLTLSDSKSINDANLRKCLHAAQSLLGIVKTLKDYKTIDTTWYNCAVYILAIQTTLYSHNQFRDELTAEKFAQLKSDMDIWLDILGEVGCLLGSGLRLKHTISGQIEKGLSQLEQHLHKADIPALKREQSEHTPINGIPPDSKLTSSINNLAYRNENTEHSEEPHQDSRYHTGVEYSAELNNDHTGLMTNHHQYHQTNRASYDDNMATAYPSAHVGHGPQPLINDASQSAYMTTAMQAPVMRDANGILYANHANSNNMYVQEAVYGGENLTWYQYTQTIAMSPHSYQPAPALIQLGPPPAADGSFHALASNREFDGGGVQVSANQMWPLVILDPQPDEASGSNAM